MPKFNVNSIQFDSDGVISFIYMNMEDGLRREGRVFRTHTVSLAPSSGDLYSEAKDILQAAYELLESLEHVYAREGAWLPSEEDEPEEDDDLGMGWG